MTNWPFPACRLPPATQHQGQLVLATDQRHEPTGAKCHEAVGDRALLHHTPRPHRQAKTPQCQLAKIVAREQTADLPARRIVDDDAVRLGDLL